MKATKTFPHWQNWRWPISIAIPNVLLTRPNSTSTWRIIRLTPFPRTRPNSSSPRCMRPQIPRRRRTFISRFRRKLIPAAPPDQSPPPSWPAFRNNRCSEEACCALRFAGCTHLVQQLGLSFRLRQTLLAYAHLSKRHKKFTLGRLQQEHGYEVLFGRFRNWHWVRNTFRSHERRGDPQQFVATRQRSGRLCP